MVGMGATPWAAMAMRAQAQRSAQSAQRQSNIAAQRGGVFRLTRPTGAVTQRWKLLVSRPRPRPSAALLPVTVTPPILVQQPGWTPPVISAGGGPAGATTPLDTGATEQMATDAADDAAAQPVLKAGLPGGPIGALLVLGLVLAFVGRKRR